MPRIPPSVIGTAAPLLAGIYTHDALDALFMAHGFPGEPPAGSKVTKTLSWLRRANKDCNDPLAMFAQLIAELMDTDYPPDNPWVEERVRAVGVVKAALAKDSLSYQRGGFILGRHLAGPSRSLGEQIKSIGIEALDKEYKRAYDSIEADPPSAVTAACAILETVCKTYLEAEGHALPAKQTLGPLWVETARHLGLQPGQLADDDLKRILQGLYGIADGVAAIRTHEGSAHGRSGHNHAKRYRLLPRHARLAVHSAHTMAMFILETWEERRRISVPTK